MKRLIYFLVVALVLGGGAWSLANAAAPIDAIVTQEVPQEAAQAADSYWTPERMRNAKPHPMAARTAVPGVGPADAADIGPPGRPGLVKGGDKNSQTSALLTDDEFDALAYTGAFAGAAGVEPTPTGYGYPPPENTFFVPGYLYNTTAYYSPYRQVGRVFFTRSGVNYSCSGSSIGGRAVLTAGHCVSDGDLHWSTNEVFVPGYYNGAGPYGTWSAFTMLTFWAWHNGGEFGRDVGFFMVNDKWFLSGRTWVRYKLSQRVGWLGFAWNWSRVQLWNAFGYPAASPYNGKFMYCTQASYARTDTPMTPDTMGIGTSQTPGCSGGPWIFRFMQGNYANGVFSYYYSSQPKTMYSPYFDTAVNNARVQAIAY